MTPFVRFRLERLLETREEALAASTYLDEYNLRDRMRKEREELNEDLRGVRREVRDWSRSVRDWSSGLHSAKRRLEEFPELGPGTVESSTRGLEHAQRCLDGAKAEVADLMDIRDEYTDGIRAWEAWRRWDRAEWARLSALIEKNRQVREGRADT